MRRCCSGAFILLVVLLQVLSGGVVLQLTAGQKVWLESFRDQQKDSEVKDRQDKTIYFSGFLIFSD